MPVSPQRLWDWHASPGTFLKLAPPWEDVRLVSWLDAAGQPADGLLADGVRVTLQARIGPFRPLWVSLLQAVEPGAQFEDIQLRGAFAYWRHRHRFLPDPAGDPARSVLEDSIDYRLPGGALGQLLGGAYVRRRLERLFDYRHRVTLESFASTQGV